MRKILVVDDALVVRMLIRKILERAGFDVVGEAKTGSEAVEKYKELRPDVVTMDIIMDEMDGLEATDRIKRFDPGAMVIITSSVHQKEMMARAFEAGACSYIVKPFEEERIVSAVKCASSN